jgi:phosphohistidine phosphatase
MAKSSAGDGLIYLVRHGKAEDGHPLGDAARGLTAEGRRAFRALLVQIAGRLNLKGIASSPLVRAVQTAELLAQATRVEEVRIEGVLDYEQGSAAELLALARTVGAGWALVGHNPTMGEALAQALGLGSEAAQFRKGAIAALRPPAEPKGRWALAWVVSPGRDFTTEL